MKIIVTNFFKSLTLDATEEQTRQMCEGASPFEVLPQDAVGKIRATFPKTPERELSVWKMTQTPRDRVIVWSYREPARFRDYNNYEITQKQF